MMIIEGRVRLAASDVADFLACRRLTQLDLLRARGEQVAVANGVRSTEHGNLLDTPAAALMAEGDAFLVPTLVTYGAMERRGAELGLAAVAQAKNCEVLEAGRTAIRLAREAGVRIGFGTDLMGALDDEQLHGLRLQH